MQPEFRKLDQGGQYVSSDLAQVCTYPLLLLFMFDYFCNSTMGHSLHEENKGKKVRMQMDVW
jgi:hypothetical protein